MKSTFIVLLLGSAAAWSQDISTPQDQATPPFAATSQGTIDQPSADPTGFSPSQATQPSLTSTGLPASAPLQPTAPLSPGLPTSPLSALAPLQPSQPSQPSPTTAASKPQAPTPSADAPTPLIVSSVDGTSPPLQSGAQVLVARTVESMQYLSNSLHNLVRIKNN